MQEGGGSLGTTAGLQLWPPSAEGLEDRRAAEDQGCSASILQAILHQGRTGSLMPGTAVVSNQGGLWNLHGRRALYLE